jgi:hypothetical protein
MSDTKLIVTSSMRVLRYVEYQATVLPPLSGKDFAGHDPGFQLGVVGKTFLPTGSYDSDEVISVGSNRFAGQVELPMTYAFGSSMADPKMTTFEVLPSVTIFSDNTDPSGDANTTGQKPLFALESHVTQNFSRTIWGSIGGLYTLAAKLQQMTFGSITVESL